MNRMSRPALDLRLVPGAIAVWAVTIVGLHAGWQAPAVITVLACGGVFAGWLTRRRPGGRVLIAASLLVIAAGSAIAVRAHEVKHDPLRVAAERGTSATVHVTLTDTPRQLRGESYGTRQAGDRSMAPARVRAAEIHGNPVESTGRVVLLVPTRGWHELTAGQRVSVRGQLAPARPGELTVAAVSAFDRPAAVGPSPTAQRIAEKLRVGLRQTAAEVLGPAAAGLLPGLVIGDIGGLPAEVERDFHIAGLTHLTAVSGANLAIVCGAVLLALRLAGVGPIVSAFAAAAALLGFVLLCGPEPSVLRAAAMGLITLLALVLGRERSTLPVLAASVLVLLVAAPGLATNIGFALSVAATTGLVVLAPAWSAALHARGVPVGIAEALTVPAAAQLATAPLLAAISGGISVIGVVANLLAGPVVAPATVLGVLATVTSPFAEWPARAFVWLAGPELGWILGVAEYAAAVPGALVSWPDGVFGGLALAGLTLVLLVAARAKRFRWALVVVAILAVLAIPARGLISEWPARGWHAVACDVGQGDALVLATGRPGEAVVVDTAPDAGHLLDCLRRLDITRVPLIVLSHLHADHIGGLDGLLAQHDVGGVAVGPMREPASAMRDVAGHSRRHGVPLFSVHAGQSMNWPDLDLDVLAPLGSLTRSTDEGDANDASVVLRARTPAGSLLLTGDIELSGQHQLMWSDARLDADVLKVPHHGSRYTSPRFVRAVNPRIAVISVGDGNDYGHPSPELLGMLGHTRAEILRTDEEGDVAVLAGTHGPRPVTRGDPVRPQR